MGGEDHAQRRTDAVGRHRGERLVEVRSPVPHPHVDGQREAVRTQPGAEGVGLADRQLIQRRAAPDPLVVVRHLLEPGRRNRAPAGDVEEEGSDVLGPLGAAEGDQQDGLRSHARQLSPSRHPSTLLT